MYFLSATQYNSWFTLTTARSLLRFKKRDETLKPRAVINMLTNGGFL
jgi:hypothetical protein